MKANWLPLSVAVALALSSVAASAVDFHGYARAGAQASMEGGDVYCSGNGKRGHKVGRLGDECDTYAELIFNQEVYNKANSKFDLHTLVMFGTKEQDSMVDRQGGTFQNIGFGDGDAVSSDGDGINHNSGQRASLRELWSGYTSDLGYTIWAGRRYYQRKDIHIWDFYYLNNSGTGAGIENISLGANMGNLAFAVIKGQNSGVEHANNLGDEWRNLYKLDARWNAIPVGFGTIDASVIYALPWISDYQKKKEGFGTRLKSANSGVLVTLDHASNINTDNVSVMNHFIVQYGTNGFGNVGYFDNHVGEYYSPMTGNEGVRVIDWGTLDAGNFGLGYSFFWSHFDDDYSSTDTWVFPRSGWEYAVTLRPEYKWTEYTRTTLELGYSQEKSVNNNHHGWDWKKYDAEDPDIYKVTLAQQFTPGKGFWTRPAIRFYVSYIGGDQFSNGRVDKLNDHNYQVSIGTQVEAWW